MSATLEGKTLLLTRTKDQSGTMKERIGSLRGEAITLPVLKFMSNPLSQAEEQMLQQVNSYDWIILTSVNAVAYFFERLDELDIKVEKPKIAAVGPKTAASVHQQRKAVDLLPEAYTAESLAASFQEISSKQSVLLPQGQLARLDLKNDLVAMGHTVDSPVLYSTSKDDTYRSELTRLTDERAYDVVVFASPSAVRYFMELLPATFMDYVRTTVVIACIGPTTAAEAERYGLTPDVVPQEYTADALILAIADYYKEDV